MFYIRRALIEDLSTLLKLGKMVHFINLPADRDIISEKILRSRNSFKAVAEGRAQRAEDAVTLAKDKSGAGLVEMTKGEMFMFALAETDNPGCLGTSQIISRMGGPGNPNVCFKLERREMFSPGLQTGTSHTVARLYLDDSAPSEIGGLILQPSYRGHPQKLGRFISLVRFHFVGLHRDVFRDTILAEMMAQITPDGHNLFWDYFGRRFIPLSYTEADRLCQYSREFIMSLLPKDDIYLSLLPPEARAGVAQVGAETVPARRMLEQLGFAYRGFVDPFDAGPYLHAQTDQISIVKQTRWAELGEPVALNKCTGRGFVSHLLDDGDFYAVAQPFYVDGEGRVCLTKEATATLQASPGDRIGLTDFSTPIGPEAAKSAEHATTSSKPAASRTARTKKTSGGGKKSRASRKQA